MIVTYPAGVYIPAGAQVRAFLQGQPVSIIFIAPLDLRTGDSCTVNSDDGTLLRVERRGVVVWEKGV